MLSGVNGGSPWADDPAEGAGNLLECALGPYTSGLLTEWQLPVEFDAVGAASRVPGVPHVWFFLLIFLVASGLEGAGVNWMMMWVKAELRGLAVVSALFLVLIRLFRELSFGVSFLHCRLLMLRTLVWIILVWCGILGVCRMIMLFPVLLSS